MYNIKDINIKDIKQKDITLYQDNGLFLDHKIEKVTMAVYMITDFFPADEPLRNRIREKSLELMSFRMSFIKFDKKGEIFDQIKSIILEVESLLKISLISKNISEMNYNLVSKEYSSLRGQIDSLVNPQNFLELKSFFEKEKENDKGQDDIKDIKDTESYKGQLVKKDTIVKDIKNLKDKKTKTTKTKMSDSDVKKDRKEAILKFIKDKKQVSVKDIVGIIKDCSEKTIQRDLIELVSSGSLKKEGERRWSRYSIK